MSEFTPEQLEAWRVSNQQFVDDLSEEDTGWWDSMWEVGGDIFDDAWDFFTGGEEDDRSLIGEGIDWLFDTTTGNVVGAGGLALLADQFGAFDSPEQTPTGYQGGIPDYTYARQQIQHNDPNRRPGSGGRRYFTDGQFTQNNPDQVAPAGTQPAGTQPTGNANEEFLFGPEAPYNPDAEEPISADPTYNPDAEAPTSSGSTYLTDKTLQNNYSSYAQGGLASMSQGRYLRGETDGMADEIPASIDNKEPALLSDGEFVIPADIVSHLGNGNSDAGAKELEQMMARIRKARTGTPEQGKEINPNKYLMA